MVYYGAKDELQYFAISFYFIMIATKYYDNCMTEVVDCMGNPLISLSPIKKSHFILVIILVGQNFAQNLINKLFVYLKISVIQMHIISFTKIDEKICYVAFVVGSSMNMGLPGLFAMMNG